MQEAGRKLEDPNWRLRPASEPRFGPSMSTNGPLTPEQSPVIQSERSPSPTTNGHASPRFTFGVPSTEYLSFAGPGGNEFARGEPSFRLGYTASSSYCCRLPVCQVCLHSRANVFTAWPADYACLIRACTCHCLQASGKMASIQSMTACVSHRGALWHFPMSS